MKIKYLFIMACSLLFISSGCRKLVEVDGPSTSISSANAYKTNATAIGVLNSLYVNMLGSLTSPGQLNSLSCIAGLSADELSYERLAGSSILDSYYRNVLTNTTGGNSYWSGSYSKLFVVNSAIIGLTESKELTPAVKRQLLGEAHFMRAVYYFYLVNLYGEVPLVLSTDYTVNALIGKSSRDQVYQQIVSDLKNAQNLLNDSYLQADCITSYPSGLEERIRPTKYLATALLARTFLYLQDWPNAEEQATSLIANTNYFQLESIDNVFLKNNREAIWQIPSTSNTSNTPDADTFIIRFGGAPGPNNPVYLNEALTSDFQAGDKRKSNWMSSIVSKGITYFYANKYKVVSPPLGSEVKEYTVFMRLAEIYLIRAEARAQLGNLAGAVADLDKIKQRAGIPSVADTNPTIGKDELVAMILEEKKLELFTEWGHRWLDLKRGGKIDEVMRTVTPKKNNGGVWKSYQQFYPIPLVELQANPNLTPTPGYQF